MNCFKLNQILCLALPLLFVNIVFSQEQKDKTTKPAILFVSPQGLKGGNVDQDYLNELHKKGFEIDYTDRQGDFTWDRIKNYNCLVIVSCPSKKGETSLMHQAKEAPFQPEFIKLVERFLKEGGGVFVMAKSAGGDYSFYDLINPWGARIPLVRYVEKNPVNIAAYPNMRGFEKCFFTDKILSSPVSDNVHQLWLPYMEHYQGADCLPVIFSKDWKVVVKGTPTSFTEVVNTSKTGHANQAVSKDFKQLILKEPIKSPDILGIRDYQNGRIALCSMHPIHTFGQGTKWLYERRCLDKGFDKRPSDFSQLFENSLRWLSQPSLKSGAVGGYVTDPQRLIAPAQRKGFQQKVEDMFWGDKELNTKRSPLDGKLYKGLIGAQSAYSCGKGSVKEWAEAAKKAGLDFVCFMEDFAKLTPEKLQKLDEECKKYSDNSLTLFPGYSIKNNIGNRLFIYGYGTPWPNEQCLTGPKKTILNQQYQENGKYVLNSPVLNWLLGSARGKGQNNCWFGRNVGFYDFRDPKAMKIYDIKLASAAAVRYYKNHKLVEDVLDDYLESVPGTLTVLPVSVNIVQSPKELIDEVKSGNALTYAKARSVSPYHLMQDGLRWQSQYCGNNVFNSDGPLIHRFPENYRVMTYGGETFVTNRNCMTVPVHVTSDVGLKEIEIYNGKKLIRRVNCHGKKDYKNVFYMAGNIQKTMVLKATDVNGKYAISYTRTSKSYHSPNVTYCGDHVNDASPGYLAHGSGCFQVQRHPVINGGYSWDGGPTGIVPLCKFQFKDPNLKAPHIKSTDRYFANIPYLETADDSAIVVRSVRNRMYDEGVTAVNTWYSWGPMGATPHFDGEARFVEFSQPTIGVQPIGWGLESIHTGSIFSDFTYTMTFKKDEKLSSIIFNTTWHRGPWPLILVTGKDGNKCEVIPVNKDNCPIERQIGTGEWFGFYCPSTQSNGALMINQGLPFTLSIGKQKKSALIQMKTSKGLKVKPGDKLTFKLISVIDPIDKDKQGPARFMRIVKYLNQPEKLSVIQGVRNQKEQRYVEVSAKNHQVEVSIPKPAREIGITVPIKVKGLCPNWAAGYWQKEGPATGYYGPGNNRYRPAGFDFEGNVYAALFPDMSENHRVVIGHPIVCDNKKIMIEAIPSAPLRENEKFYWYVAANNPTDQELTVTFRKAMDVPGLDFKEKTVKMPPGSYLVLKNDTKPEWMALGRRLD